MKTVALITSSLPFLLQGALVTLQIAVFAVLIGLVFGFVCGVCGSKKLRVPGLAQLIDAYILIVRGTPVYVQVLIFYYVLPDLLGLNLSPMVAGILALGCNSISYVSEIVRSGINAIPDGQFEAGYVLGYDVIKTFTKIILPQVLKNSFPVLTNELAIMIKETAILSTIGILEMTKVASTINARTLQPLPLYLTIAVLYLIMTTTVSLCAKKIEKGYQYDQC